MKQLFIFDFNARGMDYGVGTYIRQLAKCISNSGISTNIVHLQIPDLMEVKVEYMDNVRHFFIPESSTKEIMINSNPSENYKYDGLALLLGSYMEHHDGIVFHLNFMTEPGLGLSLKKYFLCSVVLTVHYMDWTFKLHGDLFALNQILLKPKEDLNARENFILLSFENDKKMLNEGCDHIIAIADHSAETIRKAYQVDDSKITVIKNALKDEYFKFTSLQKLKIKEQLFLSFDEKIILFAGRIAPSKGIEILVKAFVQVLSMNPNIRLIIAGDGDFGGLLSIASNHWSKISFTGLIERKDLFRLYAIADIGIVPSLYEEFGLVALEMMMSELPVIVNDSTGLLELIEDGISGIKVKLKPGKENLDESAQLLAETIGKILDNEQFKTQIGKNGRIRFLQKYSLEKYKEQMLRFYHLL